MSDNTSYGIESAKTAHSSIKDSAPLVSQDDMAQYQRSARTDSRNTPVNNHGDHVLHTVELVGQDDSAASKKQMQDSAQSLAGSVDRAFASTSVQQLDNAARSIADVAQKTYDSSNGNAAQVKALELELNKDIRTQNRGVEFEIKDGKVVTHMVEQLSKAQAGDLALQGVTGIHKNDDYKAYLKDIIPSVTADGRQQASDVPTDHMLTPEDGKLIGRIAHKQAADLSLSPESEQKLERALNLVAGSNSQDSITKLAQMMPELITSQGGNLGKAFTNALTELGYRVQTDFKIAKELDGPREFTMHIKEPNPVHIGGHVMNLNYKTAGGNSEPEIYAAKFAVRSL